MDSSTSGGLDSMSDEYTGKSSTPAAKMILESSPQRRSEKQSEHDSDMVNETTDDRPSLSLDHSNRNIGLDYRRELIGNMTEDVGGVSCVLGQLGTVGFVVCVGFRLSPVCVGYIDR